MYESTFLCATDWIDPIETQSELAEELLSRLQSPSPKDYFRLRIGKFAMQKKIPAHFRFVLWHVLAETSTIKQSECQLLPLSEIPEKRMRSLKETIAKLDILASVDQSTAKQMADKVCTMMASMMALFDPKLKNLNSRGTIEFQDHHLFFMQNFSKLVVSLTIHCQIAKENFQTFKPDIDLRDQATIDSFNKLATAFDLVNKLKPKTGMQDKYSFTDHYFLVLTICYKFKKPFVASYLDNDKTSKVFAEIMSKVKKYIDGINMKCYLSFFKLVRSVD